MKISSNIKWSLFLFLLFIGAEAKFDIIEQAAGEVIDLTNGMRAKEGPVWERALAREAAAEKLGAMLAKEEEDRALVASASTFGELAGYLEGRESIVLDRDKFVALYRDLPRASAYKIIDPLYLLDMVHDGRFRRVFLKKELAGVSVVVLNEMNEIVHQADLEDTFFENPSGSQFGISNAQRHFFSENALVVDRDAFMQAFNSLGSVNLKYQIVNDPFRLIQWGDRFTRMAVLPETPGGVIPLIFEVRMGREIDYVEYQARSLAGYYLLEQLKSMEARTVSLRDSSEVR